MKLAIAQNQRNPQLGYIKIDILKYHNNINRFVKVNLNDLF